jgi:hypothetical protein
MEGASFVMIWVRNITGKGEAEALGDKFGWSWEQKRGNWSMLRFHGVE